MNRLASHPRSSAAALRAQYGAPLWIGMRGIARALEAAVSSIADEMRRLNRIGAGADSRGERVRLVKRALARHGQGPNRCC